MYETFFFFTTNRWVYVNRNILSVLNKLSEKEQMDYACDIRTVNWVDYLPKAAILLLIEVVQNDIYE